MPKKEVKFDGEIKARCFKSLENEMKECAFDAKMDPAEYIRAAIRELNQKTKTK